MRDRIRELFFWAVAFVNRRMPKKRQVILQSFPDVEDQLVAMLRTMAESNFKVAVIVLTSGEAGTARAVLNKLVGSYVDGIQIINKGTWLAVWNYWRSDTVLFTHGLYGFHAGPDSQLVVNMWHGMPLKGIWKASPGSRIPPCTVLLSTSEKFSNVLAAVSDIPRDRIVPMGLPRNDLLQSKSHAAINFGRAMRSKHSHFIVFLPTYRKSIVGFITSDGVEMGNTLGMSETEVARLRTTLAGSRIRMLVKPHPMSVHYGKDIHIDDNLSIISDAWLHRQGITLYEALGQCDVLITDASSVYVDFLSVEKPALCYFPDIDAYRQNRKFLLNPVEDWVPSDIYRTGEELCAALESAISNPSVFAVRRQLLREELNPKREGLAAARLLDVVASRTIPTRVGNLGRVAASQ